MRSVKTETLFCLNLQEAYLTINKNLFEGTLNPVNFSVMPKRKFAIKFIYEENTIVIGGEFSKLDREDILPQLLHEMVHVFNFQRGYEDVTANQYHTTKHFLPAALRAGLIVIKHKSQGWAITCTVPPRNIIDKEFVRKPDCQIIQKRDQAFSQILFDKSLFAKIQEEIKNRVNDSKPTKNFFLKYVCNCPPPHNSIRSGRRPDGINALNILCMNCRSKFICISENK